MCDVEIKTKYETLLNIVLSVARLSSQTGRLYTINDEEIYTVVKALEPERYEARVKELEL